MFHLAVEPAPEKTVLSVTVPKEFHFKTNTLPKASSSTNQKEPEVLQHRKPPTPVSKDLPAVSFTSDLNATFFSDFPTKQMSKVSPF